MRYVIQQPQQRTQLIIDIPNCSNLWTCLSASNSLQVLYILLPPKSSQSYNQRPISTNSASQFQLFPTFLLSVPLLMVIWSYPEQGYNSATGHFVWLVWSPRTVSHCTFVPHLHYQPSKTCSRHIFSHVLNSLIVSQTTSS